MFIDIILIIFLLNNILQRLVLIQQLFDNIFLSIGFDSFIKNYCSYNFEEFCFFFALNFQLNKFYRDLIKRMS